MKYLSLVPLVLLSIVLMASDCSEKSFPTEPKAKAAMKKEVKEGEAVAVFASGCFWCVEAIFESVTGVSEAVSGYAGGKAENANYKVVGSGYSKHAEAVEVYYDPAVVSYETLLKVFFGSHDPTTLNRQGPDAGPQYRSAIFYNNDVEKNAAEAYIAKLTAEGVFKGAITTEVSKLEKFYDAEAYHQDYEKNNPNQPYVRAVSVPRLKAFQAKYPELLKSSSH